MFVLALVRIGFLEKAVHHLTCLLSEIKIFTIQKKYESIFSKLSVTCSGVFVFLA